MKARPEWYPYKIGDLPTGNRENNDCFSFSSVHYICHLNDAFRVFEDRRIRSSLVWDESKLRSTRKCVSWASANTWFNGSIYGNVRFEFDWKELVHGKRFYWVEAIAYNPDAFRILISDNEHSDLKEYDVASGDGPLFYHSKSDTWYRNGKLTSEFLFDDDLVLQDCTKVGFEDHHPTKCRRLKSQCPYLGKRGVEVGAKLLARIVGHRRLTFAKLFLDADSTTKCLHPEAVSAYRHLQKSFKVKQDLDGTIEHAHPSAPVLVSAILDNYGWDRPKAAGKLRNLFKSTEELRFTFRDRMMSAFGVNSEQALTGEEEYLLFNCEEDATVDSIFRN